MPVVTRFDLWFPVCCVEDSSEAATEVTWPFDMVSRGVVSPAVAPAPEPHMTNQHCKTA